MSCPLTVVTWNSLVCHRETESFCPSQSSSYTLDQCGSGLATLPTFSEHEVPVVKTQKELEMIETAVSGSAVSFQRLIMMN